MASKRRNMFYQNKKQETTEEGVREVSDMIGKLGAELGVVVQDRDGPTGAPRPTHHLQQPPVINLFAMLLPEGRPRGQFGLQQLQALAGPLSFFGPSTGLRPKVFKIGLSKVVFGFRDSLP
ncbi:hypothetical protein AAG570_005964 [Ranatra chinensis]|uniref:Uncharacterized protein n=1 Tax=Ranatra chinensis TaxID=642074 RepID=A0ABD0XWM5_9HEMI